MGSLIVIVALIITIVVFIKKRSGIHFIKKIENWSIGIYTGNSPDSFIPHKKVDNPVLTIRDITDIKANTIADPFMVKEGNIWHMFFEVMNSSTNLGCIGLAVSDDNLRWSYKQIILSEPFHLSYPYVFKYDEQYYMIPESRMAGAIRLYKALDFPYKWSLAETLIRGDYADSSVFNYNGRWWMFTLSTENGLLTNDTLRLFYSYALFGPWFEHPQSPIIQNNPHIARPAGRVLVSENRIIRYAQDDYPVYGKQIYAFEISELTATSYKEHRLSSEPILKASGKGWNKDGMHHVDAHRIDGDKWIACVDGYVKRACFKPHF